MCGIAGIIQLETSSLAPLPPIPDAWLDAITAHLAHRGPDAEGRFRDSQKLTNGAQFQVALVHTRLAIIDPATGQQPMYTSADLPEDDPNLVSVIFNGCIYNHRALRQELESRGRRFRTDHADTEVILRGYEEWQQGGDEVLPQHLDGMFAYAIYDRQRCSVTLARDRCGEKPLYFCVQRRGSTHTVVFASTIAAIQSVLDLLNETCAIESESGWQSDYLAHGYCAPTNLPVKNIQLLKPAHVLTFGSAGMENAESTSSWFASPSSQYWKPHTVRTSTVDPVTDFDALLRQSVHDRLEADVSLGCFLSGGLDSSLITKYALEEVPNLKTYCVRMPDPRYDESAIATEVASHLNSDHTTLEIDQASVAEDLVHLITQLGHPFADSSILPTYWISKAARQHVKVALSGDGGDELFLGYERFQAAEYLQRYRAALRFIPSWPLARFHPKSKLNKLARLAVAARGLGYDDLTSFFNSAALPRIDASYCHPVNSTTNGIDAAQLHEFSNYLPDDLLRKVDTAAMSVALEVRAPFLAPAVIERALTTPIEQLMPGRERKGLLKNIARQYLPEKIVNRPKMGFAIPLGEWFRNDFGSLRTLLEDHLNAVEPFGNLPLSVSYARQLMREHLDHQRDQAQRLFALLTLAIWARK